MTDSPPLRPGDRLLGDRLLVIPYQDGPDPLPFVESGEAWCYRVRDARRRREAFLKIYRIPSAARRAKLLDLIARLRGLSPAICGPFELFTWEGRDATLAPYLPGRSVEEFLLLPCQPPLTEVLRLLGELAYGLAALHRRGVVHCDVKAANLYVGVRDNADGSRSLFGFVVDVEGGRLAGHPHWCWTPLWAPPEGAGAPAGDVFGWGAVAWKWLTNTWPWGQGALFVRERLEEAKAGWLLAARPEELEPALGKELGGLLIRCLSPDPDRRPDAARIGRWLCALRRPEVRVCPRCRRYALGACCGAALSPTGGRASSP